LFERFFGSKESQQYVPSSEGLENRNKEFELRLKELLEKRDNVHRRMSFLEREQDDLELGRKPHNNGRNLGTVLSEKGELWREIDAVQTEINRVFEEMQQDDEALKNVMRHNADS
jgi:hypothetical protein